MVDKTLSLKLEEIIKKQKILNFHVESYFFLIGHKEAYTYNEDICIFIKKLIDALSYKL